ncbi:3-oxo-5-alpha-steroid 4-dehydrogenase [Nocardia farcinica]|uniref:3-oxo-5-alpha-steroid 4-dehydrogenase n=1 Tax=Nocardia farcinica TaxID=37329 RepID=A0A0H5P7H1_NOCFR|nr:MULTISPECIES: methyltransferase [Nocardia]AXK88137.1 3-oxo-5-alpha-steroid 4-dehydrogenase [Nocardia farcinica]MBF6184991.1 3-oxo-5-alpha-steroid 4-dehydrogenase [Nocardia farcinica]MBF6253502.1 3-oxo-5-alpha-steroid 4-dehydrogenase [Nocardia farcinica]MBF6258847.1 3-oxo-5-alpha-steroid 4-dehydrogenase [Nocardia farcinica]MBF6265210.1 3-oxo-5-alpha-steroid 4-dehydrogenase [Nocardia farcinica]
MDWYTGNTGYDTVLTIGFAFAAFVIVGGLFAQSPYGRFAPASLGFNLSPKLGWWLMELPATVVFAVFFLTGPDRFEPVPLVLAGIWLLHYANRGWFFPLAIRQVPGKRSTFNVSVLAAGMFVTSLHGYLNGAFFSHDYKHQYGTEWLTDPRFLIGLAVYLCGFALLVRSESIVRNLRDKRDPGAAEYRIPYGGGFRFVSSPAYLGELVAWAGFALLTWSLAGVVIFLITAGNLVPRAFATHRWYREKFADYPRNRKALIPFVI